MKTEETENKSCFIFSCMGQLHQKCHKLYDRKERRRSRKCGREESLNPVIGGEKEEQKPTSTSLISGTGIITVNVYESRWQSLWPGYCTNHVQLSSFLFISHYKGWKTRQSLPWPSSQTRVSDSLLAIVRKSPLGSCWKSYCFPDERDSWCWPCISPSSCLNMDVMPGAAAWS